MTMAYTDYPADTSSRNVLVNDLDLTVSHVLSTKFQPVSLVITGDFDFDKVKVEDDTAQDYEDVPGKEPFDFLGFLKTILPGLLGVLFVVFL